MFLPFGTQSPRHWLASSLAIPNRARPAEIRDDAEDPRRSWLLDWRAWFHRPVLRRCGQSTAHAARIVHDCLQRRLAEGADSTWFPQPGLSAFPIRFGRPNLRY